MSIPDATLDEWERALWRSPVPSNEQTRIITRLIAAYRESQAEVEHEAENRRTAFRMWEQEVKHRLAAEADLAALRAEFEALAYALEVRAKSESARYCRAIDVAEKVRSLLSTSTGQPETHPSHYSTPVGHPGAAADCRICPPSTDQPEGDS